MKHIVLAALAAAIIAPAFAQTYVKPHVRKDGTYVEGHYRSAPNKTDLDNYSTRGNTNPFTGETGTQRPSYEQPYKPAPLYEAPTAIPFSTPCGYTASGRYVCR